MKETIKPLSEDMLEKWAKVYYFAEEIAHFVPWAMFSEKEHFYYFNPKEKTSVHYRFICESMDRCGIACYFSDDDYYTATRYLLSENRKCEPVPYLQNALIGLWGKRKGVSEFNYSVLKQLGLRGHGDGSWLHFERYDKGYRPTTLSEDDVDRLGDALGNLFMMVQAFTSEKFKEEIKPGMDYLRWFEAKDDQYYNTVTHFRTPLHRPRYEVNLHETPHLLEVRQMPKQQFTMLLDWSYLPYMCQSKYRDYYPILLLAVSKDGFILGQEVFTQDNRPDSVIFSLFDEILKKLGKPREIKVCDSDLWCFIEPLARMTNIKATKVNRLPALERARKAMLKNGN